MLLARRNENWLPSIFNDLLGDEWIDKVNSAAPAMNVIEDDKNYTMELAVPGLSKDDLKIQLEDDNVLSVAMEHKNEEGDKDKKGRYVRHEFSYQSFRQSYVLPDNADCKGIEAHVENGVLKVIVPKQTVEQQAQAVRQIAIK